MSEDEIRTEIFKLWTKDGPVQMEYVTDSGKGPSRHSVRRHRAVTRKGRQARGYGERGVGTDQRRWEQSHTGSHRSACTPLYGDGAGYIEVMDLTMELKSAYDARNPA